MKKLILFVITLTLCLTSVAAIADSTNSEDIGFQDYVDALSQLSLPELTTLKQRAEAEIISRLSDVEHTDNLLDGLMYASNGTQIRINGYEGTNPELVIPSEIDGVPVTMIAEGAFKDNAVLVSVTLPDTITEIKDETFSGCKNLAYINLPSGLVSVGRWAFNGCYKLSSIELPEGVTTLSNAAFQRAEGLTGIFVIPSTVKALNGFTFSRCDKLSGVIIQNDLTIENSDFACYMKFLYIKDGSKVAFNGKKGTFADTLEVAVIPASVTVISEEIFDNCPHLTIVTPAGSFAEKYAQEHWIMCNTKDYEMYTSEYNAYLTSSDAE